MHLHTIDPSIEGSPSDFAEEYADQLSREFQETPDRISEGIPQFDVLILGLDAEGKAAGLAAPPTPSAPLHHALFIYSIGIPIPSAFTNAFSLKIVAYEFRYLRLTF